MMGAEKILAEVRAALDEFGASSCDFSVATADRVRMMGKAVQLYLSQKNALIDQLGALGRERDRFREALEGMCHQHCSVYDNHLSTDALSANEDAFAALGWNMPCHPVEGRGCDEPGCKEGATCGFPIPGGYRRTCGKHYREAEAKLKRGE